MREVFKVIKLHIIRILKRPILIFSPLNLILEGALFTQLLKSFSLSGIALLHFLEQNRLEKVEIVVDNFFHFDEALIQEILVEYNIILQDPVRIKSLQEQRSVVGELFKSIR